MEGNKSKSQLSNYSHLKHDISNETSNYKPVFAIFKLQMLGPVK
jgi:hypothetical protein